MQRKSDRKEYIEMEFESRVTCNYYFKNLFIHTHAYG